ncbi:MAG: hypothetical protein BWZ07_03117 [Alphaproteobacteria bacterium ADurb.BinA280]|nr:MAG: hypothetical protein BWZ07_03117 [Alphaproteobacteria bacterium ADurb.BinA280]
MLDAIEVHRATTFDVDRYSTQIDEALKGLTIPWGPEALKAIWKKLYRCVVSDASEHEIHKIDAEIDATIADSYDIIHAAALNGTAAAPAK